jgi:hypothetical protein
MYADKESRAVHLAEGVTASERYLHRLCKRSFLSLWSYPGIYRDQGQRNGGDGKEVCDLLVVFQNHILIFSDKDCAFPNTGNLGVDWCRWFRRAVLESANQVWGAERWIRQNPNRLFLDRACTKPFPIDLPDPSTAKFHRIVVAHGTSGACKARTLGSGSLALKPSIVAAGHHDDPASVEPFVVGEIDASRGFIHVLDDATLAKLMAELDTVIDFVCYLAKKEDLVRHGLLANASCELDLLAHYFQGIDGQGEHEFILPRGEKSLDVRDGLWEAYVRHPRRQARVSANRISYSWDLLIESFNKVVLSGTSHVPDVPFVAQEATMRVLASESRTHRRLLAFALTEFIRESAGQWRNTRVALPKVPGRPAYVFVLLSRMSFKSDAEYRQSRLKLLYAACMAATLKMPAIPEFVVGIATEPIGSDTRSEDIFCLETRDWSAERRAEAERLQREFQKLLRTHAPTLVETLDYPEPISVNKLLKDSDSTGSRASRNSPCPCGSGKKFKHCCRNRR